MLRVLRGPGLPALRSQLRATWADLIRAGRGDAGLWIVPTHRGALWLAAALMRESGVGAAAAPRVYGLEAFIDRFAPPSAVASPGQLLLATHEAVAALQAGDAAAVRSFVTDAGVPRAGAVNTLASVYLAVRRESERIPEGRTPLDRAASQVFRAIRERLEGRGLIDEAACARRALQGLTPAALSRAFGACEFAVVDGFDEFDARLRRVLGVLAAWAADVALVVDDPVDRPALRQHMEEALAEFTAEAAELVEVAAPAAPALASAFGGPRRPVEAAGPPHVTLRLCRTPHDEVVFLARFLRDWSRAHPAVPLRRIAVTFAEPGRYEALVREVFTAWGLPHNLSGPSAGGMLAEAPLGQAALGLWRLAARDFPRRELAALARHRLWRGAYRLRAEVIEREGRELRVARGAALWRERVGESAQRAEALAAMTTDQEIEDGRELGALRRRRLRELRALRAGLERLGEDLEPLTRPGTLFDALTHLRSVLVKRRATERLLTLCAHDAEASRRVLAASAALDALIGEIDAAGALAGRRLEPGEALALGERLFAQTPMEARPPDTDAIQVLGRHELRGLPWVLICVGGLIEGAWPQRPAASPFRDDSPFAPPAEPPGIDLSRQRHAFWQILRSGADELVFTRPASIDDAPVNPSPFLEEVAALLGREDEIGGEDAPVWKIEDIASLSACRAPCELQWTAAALIDEAVPALPEEQIARSLLATHAVLRPVAEGLGIIRARRRLDGFSPWEGRLRDAGLLAFLARRAEAHVWSATELERLSACAWRAGVERELGLSAWDEDDEEGVHRLERGQLIHTVLCDFLRRWRAQTGRDRAVILPAERDSALSLMRRVAEQALARTPAGALLWEIERELLLGTGEREGLLTRFVEDDVSDGGGFAPVHLEWRFGWAANRPGPEGTEGGAAALELETGRGVLRVRGVIDRVECTADRALWAVVDYKSGRGEISRADALAGLHLQIPLYALAVDRLLASPRGSVAAGSIRRIARLDEMESKFLFALEGCGAVAARRRQTAEEIAELIQSAAAHAASAAQHAAEGDFAWTTRPRREVCERCDWQRVCRREETKAQPESGDAGEEGAA